MTLTLKYLIHQVFILCWWEVIFVFFAIFGLGKVLWFCLTKVSDKNQSYTNLYWFCKNLQIGTKCGEKTRLEDTQKTKNSKKSQNISELKKKIQFPVYKGILVHFKSVTLQNLDCTDCTLVELYFYMFMSNCVLTEHLAE